MPHDVIIVGAGQAGARCALALRGKRFAGSVLIVGAEPDLPYDRPPLSKEYCTGRKTFKDIRFKSAEEWAALGVELRLGQPVISIDPDKRTVTTSDGSEFGYGRLVWAAGGDARKLDCQGGDLENVFTVRKRADVDALLRQMDRTTDAVVIGGGYIGLEMAAHLRGFGKRVTLVETEDRVLARVTAEPVSRFFESVHREEGVDIRLAQRVASIEGRSGEVSAVRLASGEILPAQTVVVGIGIEPSVEALLAAGAEGRNGVMVDRFCRTTLDGVFAIGDCAEHRNLHAGGKWVRVESVQNANDQAASVAGTITGIEDPYTGLPWFWSNQYDIKLQAVGLSSDYDDIVVRGDPRSKGFSVLYLREGLVVAVDSVNNVRDYTHGRALIIAKAQVPREALKDATIPLRDVLPAV